MRACELETLTEQTMKNKNGHMLFSVLKHSYILTFNNPSEKDEETDVDEMSTSMTSGAK